MKKTQSSTIQDKRLNIVIRAEVWDGLTKKVPAGERTNFINDLIEKELQRQSRKEAWEYIQNVRNNNPITATTEEILRLKNYGRK